MLIRNGGGAFFVANIRSKGQDIEVENDETHWVGHDFFSDPSKLFQGFRVSFPVPRAARTETVDNNETITINGNRTESKNFQKLLHPGATFSQLELAGTTKRSHGFRLQQITVQNTGLLPDGGRYADMTAKSIIAILIGL
ncbi:MAG: hypothetical protein U0R19_23710 [Bryobacteraceae bacterium]